MYLVFFDGSGNTGADLTHPVLTVHYLVGVAVHGHRARALEDGVGEVLQRWFGPDSRRPGFECKGSDLFRGEGPCSAMGPADRIELYRQLVELVPAHGADVLWHGIDKRRLAGRYPQPMHPHKLAFLFFVEAVERLLRARREFGLLVSDEEKSVEQQVIEDLPRYKEIGTAFGYHPIDLKRVVDNVHWVKSHNSRLLQLADVCTYLCQRQRRDAGKTSATAIAVQELWNVLGPCVWKGRVWP